MQNLYLTFSLMAVTNEPLKVSHVINFFGERSEMNTWKLYMKYGFAFVC
jgi:hypothetical protein